MDAHVSVANSSENGQKRVEAMKGDHRSQHEAANKNAHEAQGHQPLNRAHDDGKSSVPQTHQKVARLTETDRDSTRTQRGRASDWRKQTKLLELALGAP